jgi:MYXO-CTERM domain-containing protein
MLYRMPLMRAGASFGCFLVGVLVGVPALAVSGAELVRNEPFRYGRFEARMQFAAGDGVVSTFFLWKDGSERPDVFWNEIDIEKLGANCSGYSSNALYGLPQSNHTLDIVSADDLCGGYHTHVVEWTPDYLAWLLDGTEVRRITGADALAFEENALPGMQMRFNIWVGNASFGGNLAPGVLPVHQYINWVSYSAYTPGSGDEGTDFTRVWREDFGSPLDAGWSLGTWASPFDNSVHSPSNVSVVDGKAVLSLTPDDMLGFTGTPPDDLSDDELPGASPPPPDASPTPNGSVGAGSRPRASGGCSVQSPFHSPAGSRWWLLFGAAGLWRGRRRGTQRPRGRSSLTMHP